MRADRWTGLREEPVLRKAVDLEYAPRDLPKQDNLRRGRTDGPGNTPVTQAIYGRIEMRTED
jgi:hypothetical protein